MSSHIFYRIKFADDSLPNSDGEGEEPQSNDGIESESLEKELHVTHGKPGSRNQSKDGSNRCGSSVRRSYPLYKKMEMLRKYDDLLSALGGKTLGAKRILAEEIGIAETTFGRWVNNRGDIERDYKASLGKRGRGYRGRVHAMRRNAGNAIAFSHAEEVVYRKFTEKRKKGAKINGTMLKHWMLDAVQNDTDFLFHANKFQLNKPFKASSRWLRNFVRRYNLALRRKTNVKNVSIEERLPKIKAWHARLSKRIMRLNGLSKSLDPHFGRWKPEHRYFYPVSL